MKVKCLRTALSISAVIGQSLVIFLLLPTQGILGQTRLEGQASEKRRMPANANQALSTSKGDYTRNDVAFGVTPLQYEQDASAKAISTEMLKAAITLQAEQRWSLFSIGPAIPCCDDNGKLFAYHVPVAPGRSHFPSVLTPVPSHEIQDGSLRDRSLWGVRDYWTFVVSAREADFPIPVYYQGLPPFLVTYHKAGEVAREYLADSALLFSRYYCLGHRGDFFEFRSPGGATVLINAHTLENKPPNEVLTRSSLYRATDKLPSTQWSDDRKELKEIYQKQVADEWDKIRARIRINQSQ